MVPEEVSIPGGLLKSMEEKMIKNTSIYIYIYQLIRVVHSINRDSLLNDLKKKNKYSPHLQTK